jgi:hypothetical protein
MILANLPPRVIIPAVYSKFSLAVVQYLAQPREPYLFLTAEDMDSQQVWRHGLVAQILLLVTERWDEIEPSGLGDNAGTAHLQLLRSRENNRQIDAALLKEFKPVLAVGLLDRVVSEMQIAHTAVVTAYMDVRDALVT